MAENTIQIFGITVTINPVAFTIPGIEWKVYWYGIIIALGFILAVLYCFNKAKSFNINADRLLDCVLVTAPVAVICARLYYVIFNGTPFSEFFNIHEGGLAILGAVIGTAITGTVMCKARGVDILSALDLTALGFLIGQGVGRWGNFVNQEAYGTWTNSSWFGMTGDRIEAEMGEGLLVHPCFLYESIWCLLGFVILHFLSKQRKFNGQIAVSYMIWYGFGRFIIESFRTDSLYIGTLRVSQIVCVLMVVTGAVLLGIGLKKASEKKKSTDYIPIFSDNSENEIEYNVNTQEEDENGTDN